MHDLYYCVKDMYHPTRVKEKIFAHHSKYRAQLLFIQHRQAYFWVVQKIVLHRGRNYVTLYPEMVHWILLGQEDFQDHFVLTGTLDVKVPPFYFVS